MAKPSTHGRDTNRGDREENRAAGKQRQAERIKALLDARRAAETSQHIARPGVSQPSRIRYATTAAPGDWLTADRGRCTVNAVLDAVEDGLDRTILAWPSRSAGGFVTAAIALREARSSGRLAFGTLALWPWRNGATWAARSLLVNPTDVAAVAARAVDELQHGAAWTKSAFAEESLCLLEMRLRDLATPPQSGRRAAASRVVVRNPTLLETTAVFPPKTQTRRSASYASDGQQVLRRVRDHTHMGDPDAGLDAHVAAIGDPARTPFAVFGLPADAKHDAIAKCLAFARFQSSGLDALLVDLTRTGRSELPDEWEPRLDALLRTLTDFTGRRPPVVALTEDAFSLRRAVRALRSAGAALRPARKPPLEIGAYLPEPGVLGSAVTLTTELPPIVFEADIKDATLVPLRTDLVSLGRIFRQSGAQLAADHVSKSLALLRRCASLPTGLKEAREIADILYDGEDEVDLAARSLFRPKMTLGPLAATAEMAPECADIVRGVTAELTAKLDTWDDETPVSVKLNRLMEQAAWNNSQTLLSIADLRAAEIYISSDRALRNACDIVDHRALPARLAVMPPKRVIVIGPTPEAVRALLTTPASPERVLLLGDAAGSALLAGEIGPLSRIAAFAAVAGRAQALATALKRGGADEKLDLAEAEFRVAATIPEGEIDFTRSGDSYRGDVIQFQTARGQRLVYRPNSDVLEFSPSEVRPFERRAAREIKAGDRILVLNAALREPIRRALAGSRESLKQLSFYHDRIRTIRTAAVGTSDADKARQILAKMQTLDPALPASEQPNIVRWLTADKAPGEADGGRQPRAARDWPRFRIFMQAAGVDSHLAEMFWNAAIVPARSYRVQEGYQFNQRVVQFVLDPEGATIGSAAWTAMPDLWQRVLDAVDEVVECTTRVAEGES